MNERAWPVEIQAGQGTPRCPALFFSVLLCFIRVTIVILICLWWFCAASTRAKLKRRAERRTVGVLEDNADSMTTAESGFEVTDVYFAP